MVNPWTIAGVREKEEGQIPVSPILVNRRVLAMMSVKVLFIFCLGGFQTCVLFVSNSNELTVKSSRKTILTFGHSYFVTLISRTVKCISVVGYFLPV